MAGTVVFEGRHFGRVAAVLAGEGLDPVALSPDRTGSGPNLGDVLDRISSFAPDLVVCEVTDLDESALDLCSRLAALGSVHVLMLCERSAEGDVVAGYAAGAASVVTEPVGVHELVARIRALLRRSHSVETVPDDILQVGDVVLDPGCRRLTVRGVPVPLPRREFDIAEVLMRGAGNLVTRREILDRLWGVQTSESKSLDVQVGRLRARLAEVEGCRRIITVRGIGYRFLTNEDLDRSQDGAPAVLHG